MIFCRLQKSAILFWLQWNSIRSDTQCKSSQSHYGIIPQYSGFSSEVDWGKMKRCDAIGHSSTMYSGGMEAFLTVHSIQFKTVNLLWHAVESLSKQQKSITSLKRKCHFDEMVVLVNIHSPNPFEISWLPEGILFNWTLITIMSPSIMSPCYCMRMPWASYQIRQIVGCACAGNAGNVFPATDFKGNR